jgi:hypothetical protein
MYPQKTASLFIHFLLIFSLLFVACKEDNPGIILEEVVVPLLDTSYVVTDPGISSYKKILLEDLTGVRCVNCPRAAKKAAELSTKYNDTVVVMALYIKSFETQFTSPYEGFPDLRTDEAEIIMGAVGTPTGLPNGFVDRFKFGSQAAMIDHEWENKINLRIGAVSPVRIELDFTKDNTNEVIFKTKLTYTIDQSSSQHKLALYITENDIISKQATNEPGRGGYIDDYSHQHVLRKAITIPLGEILKENLVVGRVFEKEMKFEWPQSWNIEKSYLVAVIIDVKDESVIQVAEISLK